MPLICISSLSLLYVVQMVSLSFTYITFNSGFSNMERFIDVIIFTCNVFLTNCIICPLMSNVLLSHFNGILPRKEQQKNVLSFRKKIGSREEPQFWFQFDPQLCTKLIQLERVERPPAASLRPTLLLLSLLTSLEHPSVVLRPTPYGLNQR